MKSSSELFPVALLSAEYKEGVYEDVYSLKPNNSVDKTVEIALVRLHTEQCRQSRPILLIHDAFHNHWQWLDYGLGGAAGRLARDGFDVWLLDWRGHGLSSRNKSPRLNTLKEMARHDLPAVIAFIEESTGEHPALVARGLGCEMVSLALAGGTPVPEAVFMHPPMLPPSRLCWLPGLKFARRLKYGKRRWLKGDGEEPEPRQLFTELLSKQGWFGRWVDASGEPVRPALQQAVGRIHWVFSPGRVPTWLNRLQVNRNRVFEAVDSDGDWAHWMPETWASRTTVPERAAADVSPDEARL
ncbi:alpha/beta hydrolase [Saccharospirillum salsuginis]|uniref:Esterase n=1 Tax=Saccharospirillum salsuginis TaxID=418750 RepID=A0A918K7B0_9GAMM|nr:alpha/beta fold hydrolase [Saccharospirillum salsuginis]GGX51324.1 esterase [Saccharospirillum salsuginis]